MIEFLIGVAAVVLGILIIISSIVIFREVKRNPEKFAELDRKKILKRVLFALSVVCTLILIAFTVSFTWALLRADKIMQPATIYVPWAIVIVSCIGWTIFCFKSEKLKNSKIGFLKWGALLVTAIWISIPILIFVMT